MDNKCDLQLVLFFQCPDAICIDRCLGRGSGRVDDNMDSLKRRFQVFHNDSMPIVDYFDRQNMVRRINGEPPAELVFTEVETAFKDYNCK